MIFLSEFILVALIFYCNFGFSQVFAQAPHSPSEFPPTEAPHSPSEFFDENIINSTFEDGRDIQLPLQNSEYGNVLSSKINNNTCISQGNLSSIVIDTDKPVYWPGQAAFIYLRVFDNNGCIVNSLATVEAFYIDDTGNKNSVYKQTAFSQSEFFPKFGINLQEIGNYEITANITGLPKSFVPIKVISFYQSEIASLIFLTLSFIAGLVIVTSLSRTRNTPIGEILRFVFISGISLSILSTFIFIQDEFGRGSPLGLVRISPLTGDETPRMGDQWIINIGGVPTDNYRMGIQIPIYVVIFGLAGGYLRYLYKTSRLAKTNSYSLQRIYLFEWNKIGTGQENEADDDRLKDFLKQNFEMDWIEKAEIKKDPQDAEGKTIQISDGIQSLLIKIDKEEKHANLFLDPNSKPIYRFIIKEKTKDKLFVYPEKIDPFYQSLEDISLLLLSPFLAIATWFLLIQLGLQEDDGIYILAAISFTVGLVTDDVIHSLIRFVSSRIGNVKI
jgi:hypothetical protein